MSATFILRTDHAKLRLSVNGALTEEEWEALSTDLSALRPVVVSQGAQTVTKLLEDLEEPDTRGSGRAPHPSMRVSAWETLNTLTYAGPLDAKVMGLRLEHGESARVIPSHESVHVDVMHRWTSDRPHSNEFTCGHGGCHATAIVTKSS